MAFNAIALLPEVTGAAPNVNDDAEHALFIQQASDAWASGQDPLDFWVPQVELGFPQFLYYQNIPHLVVVVLGKLTFGLISLRTLFDLVRYVLLVGFPLTVFWSMRRLGFSDVAAAIGTAAGSLLGGNHRYGFEYDSYVWRGLGVYTQIFGMHLSFLALAALHRVATRGTGIVVAALVCGALALSHLIYAYMTAITAVVLLLFGLPRAKIAGRVPGCEPVPRSDEIRFLRRPDDPGLARLRRPPRSRTTSGAHGVARGGDRRRARDARAASSPHARPLRPVARPLLRTADPWPARRSPAAARGTALPPLHWRRRSLRDIAHRRGRGVPVGNCSFRGVTTAPRSRGGGDRDRVRAGSCRALVLLQ